ncbi:MAG: hypothetical protein PVJ03_09825, partial [Chromatiaceae bacterium]
MCWSTVSPKMHHFKKSEDQERGADEYHGIGGPLTLAASQVTVFIKSDPSVERPDIQFHMQPLSAHKPGDGAHKSSAFISSVCQLRPHSRGHMEMKSSDPLEYP